MRSIEILEPELSRVRELRRRWYAGVAAQRELAGLLDSIALAAVDDPTDLDKAEVKLMGDHIVLQDPLTPAENIQVNHRSSHEQAALRELL